MARMTPDLASRVLHAIMTHAGEEMTRAHAGKSPPPPLTDAILADLYRITEQQVSDVRTGRRWDRHVLLDLILRAADEKRSPVIVEREEVMALRIRSRGLLPVPVPPAPRPGLYADAAGNVYSTGRTREPEMLDPPRWRSTRLVYLVSGHQRQRHACCAASLIAAARHGPPPPGHQVVFRDNDPLNLKPDNLYYAATRLKRQKLLQREIKEIVLSTESDADLAARYGVKRDAIRQIRRRAARRGEVSQ